MKSFAPPFSTIFRLQLWSYYIQYYNRKSRLVQMQTLQKTKRQKKIVFIDRQMQCFPTGTPRRIHVDSTWILRRYVQDQILTNFHVISAYFFDVISLVEESTWFPRTFFDVISMVEKPTLFPRTFFDVILMVEKSTLFHVLLSV